VKPARIADNSPASKRTEEKSMTLASAYSATPTISSGSPHGQAPQACSVKPAGSASSNHWSIFWRDFGEGDQRPERCHIPGDGRQVVDRHWTLFANGLPRGAQVLDIGCGAGTVGRTLLDCRPDLFIDGVDFAQVPKATTPNLAIQQGIRMEALPFEAGSFDAAVSLFGIEYGNIAQTARELGRVLKRGACFTFIMHHAESEIAREGSARVFGIKDALSGKVKDAFLAGDVARMDQQRLRLGNQHPDEPTVKLLSDYFERTIGHAREERQAIWRKLEDDVAVELALTAYMVRCAKSAEQMGAWLAPLFVDMAAVEVSVLRRGSGEPIAWAVGGTR
jgi:ubiquinone/menaquinone biosynthesis C-methylase UbiE